MSPQSLGAQLSEKELTALGSQPPVRPPPTTDELVLVIVSVITPPPALPDDRATYTVSLTDPLPQLDTPHRGTLLLPSTH